MDDLFQKAADNYPLRIQGGDWEKIAVKLDNPSLSPVAPRKFNKGYLSLLLFLFVLTVGGLYTNYYLIHNKKSETAQQKNSRKNQAVTLQDNSIATENKNQSTTNYTKQYKIQYSYSTKPTITNYKIKDNKKRIAGKLRTSITYITGSDNQLIEKENKGENANYINRSIINNDVLPTVPDNNTISSNKKNQLPQLQMDAPENSKEEKPIADALKNNVSNKKALEKKKNSKGFYTGIVFGPQFNQVKNQGFNKLGAKVGLLLGYSFNSKFSAESGLFFSNKRYYSDGQYFSMKQISPSMPPSMKVITVKSSATLLEIPLKGKYNFISNGNRNLFVAAGVSSYLLLREQNDYLALVNGGQQNLKGDYRTTDKYLAASFNLSAGYERRIGKTSMIRIEPYLEFPLRRLGVGSMYVFSTGLNLGITLPARKH